MARTKKQNFVVLIKSRANIAFARDLFYYYYVDKCKYYNNK